jgi:hypothetical protein
MGPKSQGAVERFSRASEAKGLAVLTSLVGAENFAGVERFTESKGLPGV